MCNGCCLEFARRVLKREEIIGKSVLEVGSRDVNGSTRPIIVAMQPKEYIGIDIQNGKGVDLICDAYDILERFGLERFDMVVSTEALEHIYNWKKIVHNIKHVLKPNGILLLTTRSPGFRFEPYPSDYWRFTESDFKVIFGDMMIVALERDRCELGVFIKALKPTGFKEADLNTFEVSTI